MNSELPLMPSATGKAPIGAGSGKTAEFQVPDDLKELDQWVLWRTEIRNGRSTKVPYRIDAQLASSTDSSTWTSFENAVECWRRPSQRYDGVGFLFSARDPYCGIDLDDCIDDAGQVKAWAQPIIATFADTYIEISPSGKGAKIWSKAKLPGNGRAKKYHDGAIEIYDRGRFFTVTGGVLNGSLLQIEEHQHDVEKLYELVTGSKNGKPQPIANKIPYGTQHNTLVSLAGSMRRRGMGVPEIFAALKEVNLLRCEKPGSDEDIRCIAESACRNWKPDPSADVFVNKIDSPLGTGHVGATVPSLVCQPYTDTGNGERLVSLYGCDIRFCLETKKWLTYDGRRWITEDSRRVKRLAKRTMRLMYAQVLLATTSGPFRRFNLAHPKLLIL